MEFKEFNKKLQERISCLCRDQNHLFEVELDKDVLWNLYLDSFPVGTNEVFRERREFDCSCCRHFVKNLGNVVAIKDNTIETIWGFKVEDSKYQTVIDVLDNFVKSKVVTEIFVTNTCSFGTEKTFDDKQDITWYHFYAKLPKNIVLYNDIGSRRGELRDIRNVFKRSLDELSDDSVDTVLELISQNSIYKGDEWKGVLESFKKLKKQYSKLNGFEKDNFCWEQSVKVGPVVGKIRNHSVGTLLTNLSEGMDLEEALMKYEAVVAPSNYKRPKAVFTKKMVEDAQNTVKELGLEDSLARRHAVLDDITVPNTLFVDRNVKQKLGMDVFGELTADTSVSSKKFDKLEEIGIDSFIKDVLPKASSLELFFDGKHTGNLVSLIAPQNKDSKSMFKWNNGFSWAYSGNITDSMKERVKSAGGKVDGVLRFSIQWNDNGNDHNDLDAHCIEPNGNEICFMNKTNPRTTGMLDVDIIHPNKDIAVENITWSNRDKMSKGVYKFFVNNYSHRGGRNGFSAEIEFDGQIYKFNYNKELRQKENVQVAEITMLANGEFKIKELIPSNLSSRKIWGINTEQFHKVSIAMYSPNYWNEQDGIGHRHYLFMLQDCKNDENPNGFFNEFLREDLMKHKRVFEALGAKMKVEDSDNQLSGLGFSATKHTSFVVKVEGTFKRILKVNI